MLASGSIATAFVIGEADSSPAFAEPPISAQVFMPKKRLKLLIYCLLSTNYACCLTTTAHHQTDYKNTSYSRYMQAPEHEVFHHVFHRQGANRSHKYPCAEFKFLRMFYNMFGCFFRTYSFYETYRLRWNPLTVLLAAAMPPRALYSRNSSRSSSGICWRFSWVMGFLFF